MDFQLNQDAQIGSLVFEFHFFKCSPVRFPMWILKLHLEIFHKYAPLGNFTRKTMQ